MLSHLKNMVLLFHDAVFLFTSATLPPACRIGSVSPHLHWYLQRAQGRE